MWEQKMFKQLAEAIIAKRYVCVCRIYVDKWTEVAMWCKKYILFFMWPCLIKRHFNDDRCISKLIFSNIWPLSVAVGQGYPDVNNNETNYDDEDSNSPCHNCNVLVTEWDKWQDITYLWRQLMMWSVGRLWFPGDHYLPHWPMKPGSAAVNEFISSLYLLHKMLLATHDLCWSNIGPFRGRLSSGLVWMMFHTQ